MHIKNSLLAAGIATSIGLAGIAGVGAVSAMPPSLSVTDDKGVSSLVTKIADKFNLSESDVQAVFDENEADIEAVHKAALEKKIADAVTEGTITQDQADAIIAKQSELKTSREAARESMKDKTPQEQKAAMESERAELKQWATDNGLSEDVLRDLLMAPKGGLVTHDGPDGIKEGAAPKPVPSTN